MGNRQDILCCTKIQKLKRHMLKVTFHHSQRSCAQALCPDSSVYSEHLQTHSLFCDSSRINHFHKMRCNLIPCFMSYQKRRRKQLERVMAGCTKSAAEHPKTFIQPRIQRYSVDSQNTVLLCNINLQRKINDYDFSPP